MEAPAATPAEKELRQAKESIALLNQLTAQAERGNAIDYEKAQQILAEATAPLSQLSQGILPSAGGVVNPAGASSGAMGSGLYARVAGSQAVTELQRRRAQQALSELQLIETTLRRYQKKQQQKQSHASQMQDLLGKGGSRSDYSEMDLLERERQSLQYTRDRLRRMNTESDEVLKALQGQGNRLGGTGDKLADLMESLGVSNTTILQIVRRNQMDAWLVYGGITLMIFFMWYLW